MHTPSARSCFAFAFMLFAFRSLVIAAKAILERSCSCDITVKTHITHILQKLGLRDRVQAVVLAYQTGLFEADVRRPVSRNESPTA
jgi:ABC-type maltose transport system permease subunit